MVKIHKSKNAGKNNCEFHVGGGSNSEVGGNVKNALKPIEIFNEIEQGFQDSLGSASGFNDRKFAKNKASSQLKEWILSQRVLHTHNSIPSYIADLKEGCVICIKNKTLEDLAEEM